MDVIPVLPPRCSPSRPRSGRAAVLAMVVAVLAAPAWSPRPAGAEVRTIFPGHGYDAVRKMADFGGSLYALVGDYYPPVSMKVYRLKDAFCGIWEDVSPPWSQFSLELSRMIVFRDYLYLYTSPGELWRTANGKDWSRVSLQGSSGLIDFSPQVVFQGKLVGGGYCTTDGVLFQPFLALPASMTSRSANDETWEVMGTHLYLGFGLDNNNGIEIWRTDGTAGWDLYHKVPASQYAPGHVHAMKAFDGHLYVGGYTDFSCDAPQYIYRLDGLGSWEDGAGRLVTERGNVMALEVQGGALYAGVFYYNAPNCFTPATPLIYSTADGVAWAPVPGATHGSSTSFRGISTLAVFGGLLYAGTWDMATPGSPSDPGSSAEVWDVDSSLPPCALVDLHHPMVSAIPDWLWGVKNALKHEKIALTGSRAVWSASVIDDLGAALAGVPVDAGQEALRSQARQEFQALADEADAASSAANLASQVDDPNERIPLVDTALSRLNGAIAAYRSFMPLMNQLVGNGDTPYLLYDGFAGGLAAWVTRGGVAAQEHLGDPSLHASGLGSAISTGGPFRGKPVLLLSSLVTSGRLRARLGIIGGARYSFLLTRTRARLVKRVLGSPLRQARAVTLPPGENRWRFFRFERSARRLMVRCDGFLLFSRRIPDRETVLQPGLFFNPKADVWVDDLEVGSTPP